MDPSNAGLQPWVPRRRSLWLALLLVWGSGVEPVQAALAQLADLSLEELAQMPVISVSRSAKPISEAPAAIFVITETDIQRSAATSFPEVLRLAPNLQVARVDARNYAISARGFNNAFANKLLVLVDGRTIYSPLFTGVFWDAQDLVLEDLERVEVISGPGGTLWGANAVNGVINVVTRSAAQTQGGMVSLTGSANEHYAAARYGGALGGSGHYRVYGKHSSAEDSVIATGAAAATGWRRGQVGFRADWEAGPDTLTLQGDAYAGRLNQAATPSDDIEISGANLSARKRQTLRDHSVLLLQVYLDQTTRDQPLAFSQRLNILDLELQHEWQLGRRHHLMWGGGYRYADDQFDAFGSFAFLPESRHLIWRNVFAQDQIELSERLRLTVGAKLEQNPFTGWEALPSLQLAWNLTSHQLLWSGLSRVVRSPSRIDTDLYTPAQPPIINGVPQYQTAGGPGFESELADVFEIGYRSQPWSIFSYSVTGYLSRYRDLRTLEINPGGPGLVFANGARADTFGLETWGTWQVAQHWRLRAGLVLQHFAVELEPGSTDASDTTRLAAADPEFFWSLRSSYDVTDHWSFDVALREVDELARNDVPAYAELDLRLGWTIREGLVLSLIGQNLLDAQHPEFGARTERSEFERALVGRLQWGI